MRKKEYYLISGILLTFILFNVPSLFAAESKTSEKDIEFYDVRVQTKEFIDYYYSIKLTAQQDKIKLDALSGIEAPCCSNYSIATCCCPCNLAKSVWGLSHFLIAKRNYDAAKVKKAASEWIQFTHQNGYAGNACFRGRCTQPFHKDGCGGMDDKKIVF